MSWPLPKVPSSPSRSAVLVPGSLLPKKALKLSGSCVQEHGYLALAYLGPHSEPAA